MGVSGGVSDPALLSLSPTQSPEPMQEEEYLPVSTVVNEVVIAGSLTPPDTPTREDISRVDVVGTATTIAQLSVDDTRAKSNARNFNAERIKHIQHSPKDIIQ